MRCPSIFSSRYAPLFRLSTTRKGPSQLDANFPLILFFWASPFILHTKFPPTKDLGLVLALYRREALLLHASSLIFALSLSSYNRSSIVRVHSSFRRKSANCLRIVGSPTFTGNIAFVLYIKLYGVSSVEE